MWHANFAFLYQASKPDNILLGTVPQFLGFKVQALISHGFINSKMPPSLFTTMHDNKLTYFLVKVDDFIVTDNHASFVSQFIGALSSWFSIKDLGSLHYFLELSSFPIPIGCSSLSTIIYENSSIDHTKMHGMVLIKESLCSNIHQCHQIPECLWRPSIYQPCTPRTLPSPCTNFLNLLTCLQMPPKRCPYICEVQENMNITYSNADRAYS
jgi:hypothetical protein